MNTGTVSGCRKIFGVVATLLFISGCLPDESLSELDSLAPSPKMSLPLLTSNVSLSEVIDTEEGGLLQENDDNTYSVFYNTSFSSEPLSTYFQGIPDQNYKEYFSFGLFAPSFILSPPPITFNKNIPFDFNGQQVTKVGFKSGILRIGLSSHYKHEVHAAITFPEIIDPAGKELQVNFSFASSDYKVQEFDLNGFTIYPENNEVSYSIELSIKGSGAPIHPGDSIRFSADLNEVDFSYMEGNFEEFQIPIEPGELEIPLLNNIASGNISLHPKIKLNFNNSFGVPAIADFSNIIVENKNGIVTLQDKGDGDFFHDHYAFPYPENRTGLPAQLSYEINGQNSTINEAFASIPKKIYYGLGFTAGSQPGETDFIADTSQIKVDVEMEVPLAGSFDLTLSDTLEIDLSELEDVEELKMLIRTENSFPVEADLQIYFLDENQQIILGNNGEPIQLFTGSENLLKAATITNPVTGETTPSITDPPIAGVINGDQFALIQQAGYLLIAAHLNSVSDSDDNIKLYSFYDLQIDIAMQVKASFNF